MVLKNRFFRWKSTESTQKTLKMSVKHKDEWYSELVRRGRMRRSAQKCAQKCACAGAIFKTSAQKHMKSAINLAFVSALISSVFFFCVQGTISLKNSMILTISTYWKPANKNLVGFLSKCGFYGLELEFNWQNYWFFELNYAPKCDEND